LRRSRLKEKVEAGRTDDGRRTPRHGISYHGLRPGELKTTYILHVFDTSLTIYSHIEDLRFIIIGK